MRRSGTWYNVFDVQTPHLTSGSANQQLASLLEVYVERRSGKFTMSREIEPVRRSFCRHGSCTLTEVARLVLSGVDLAQLSSRLERSAGGMRGLRRRQYSSSTSVSHRLAT